MPTPIEKAQAHASHLLDAFIELRQRYALLEPMLFSEEVTKERGSGKQARGFEILKYSLFLSCSQDIAKITMDSDERAPSLFNMIRFLTNEIYCNDLRRIYSEWKIPTAEEELEPEIVAALRRFEEKETSERMKEFDELYCEAFTIWGKLSTNSALKGFRTIRDKISAHTEVQFHVDKYHLVDISKLGVKWGDIRSMIDEIQRLVELMGLIIRNSCFAWDSLDEMLSRASQGFWEIPSGSK